MQLRGDVIDTRSHVIESNSSSAQSRGITNKKNRGYIKKPEIYSRQHENSSR